MKKIVIVVILVLLFMLAGCTTDVEPPDIVPTETPFFDITSLNYNDQYESSNGEQGFIIYDNINFNTVSFLDTPKWAPHFGIYMGDELLQNIVQPAKGALYPDYRFIKTGTYTIKVYANINNKDVSGDFTINVSAGGYPNDVRFELLDENHNMVTEALAGNSYRIIAKVYSGDILLQQDNDIFACHWNGGGDSREKPITLPNYITDTTITYQFTCFVTVDGHTYNNNYFFPLQIKNNYSGIFIDYGVEVEGGNIVLSVNEAGGNFMSRVAAEHRFANGDTQDITVHYTGGVPRNDTVALFFRYFGQTEYTRYAAGLYDFSKVYSNYVSNGAVYQFDPRQNEVEAYFAYCYTDQEEGLTVRKYRKIEDSDIHITLAKTPPASITANSIEGMEKSSTGYVAFTRDIVDNAVSVKVIDQSLGDEKQHFKLDIDVDYETNMPDYVFQFGSGIRYNVVKKHFYAITEGAHQIIITSCFGESSFTLTVNADNPVVRTSIEENNIPTFFVGTPDFRPYITVVDEYYNSTEAERQLSSEEEIRLFDAVYGTPISYDTLVPNQKLYEFISVRLYQNGTETADNRTTVKFFVFPMLTIYVDGEPYYAGDSDTEYINKTFYELNHIDSMILRGYIPVITITAASFQSVSIEIADSGSYEGMDITSYPYGGYYCIVYDGLYKGNGSLKKYYYDAAQIFKIIVITE